jgi:hypothetical protein
LETGGSSVRKPPSLGPATQTRGTALGAEGGTSQGHGCSMLELGVARAKVVF